MLKINSQKFYKILELESAQEIYELSSEEIKLIHDQDLFMYLLSNGYSFNLSKLELERALIINESTYEVFKIAVVDIAKSMELNSVDYRLIKGISIAETYPKPHTRIMGDIDVIVRKESLNKASTALESIGYKRYSDLQGLKDITFIKVGFPTVELHFDLFEIMCFDFYSGYEEISELIFLDYEFLKVNGFSVKVPNASIHLKYQLLHFYKHFKTNGCGVRFLLDLHYFSIAHKINIDEIEYYFNNGQMKKFVQIISIMLKLEFKYYDLKEEEISEKCISKIHVLAEYLLLDGVFGYSDQRSFNSSRTLYYKKYLNKSVLTLFQNAFFPKKEKLITRYKYLENKPFLLPIAWFQRMIDFILRKEPIKDKFFFLNSNNQLIKSKDEAQKYLDFS